MRNRIDVSAAAANPARALHVRPGVGVAAHVLQGRELEMLRCRVEQPALILVDRGIKALRTECGVSVRARPGQAIVLGGNQTVDFTNSVPTGSCYEARWLVFDAAPLEDPYYLGSSAAVESNSRTAASARLIAQVSEGLADAFDRARQAVAADGRIPAPVARQRMLEVLLWLREEGIVLRKPPLNPNLSVRLRTLIASRLDDAWTADRVAREFALSEATLRRRLAAEGTSLSELRVETRMATALTLLQATTQPVSDIAVSVGYESASRFAVRFRQRFGFAPTAVRGHERAL